MSIVIKGAGGNGRTEIALLTFTVLDAQNTGIANQKVNFTTNSTNPVTLTSTSGTTDSSGNVTVALTSGTLPTTARVIAAVDGTSYSVMSDTIRVTTGEPVQAALSLSADNYAPEAWNWDNTKVTITALLADAYGGAVADGTPVVFTTDSGAIVGTGGAGCTTTNGECTISWRSQSPRATNGIATVVATATNGTQSLSSSIQFFMSGSLATVVPSTSALNFSASCDPQTMTVNVFDVNGNPMPTGSTLGIDSLVASASFIPATVTPWVGALSVVSGGTKHNVTITPTSCDVNGATNVSGVLRFSVTTPKGNTTYSGQVSVSFKKQ